MATKAENKVPGKRRGRPSLTEADKAHMAQRRTEAANEKKSALDFLEHNPQFRNPKFWNSVPSDVSQSIVDAIRKGGEKAKLDEIKALEAKIAALKGE